MIMSHVKDPTGSVPASAPANQSVAELIKQVSEESSRLLRGELKLAQAEMTQKAKTAGVGIGAFGVAAGDASLAGRADRRRGGCHRGRYRGANWQEEGC
jgi:Putative Actinobacterial Holin-X, holin superfamily III